MRLIDADALLKVFSEDIDTDVCQTFADYFSEWGFSHDTVERTIIDAPAIEAEPVRHGRWVEKVGLFDEIINRCSVCEEDVFLDGESIVGLYNYCPNCGAKMDAEESSATEK